MIDLNVKKAIVFTEVLEQLGSYKLSTHTPDAKRDELSDGWKV